MLDLKHIFQYHAPRDEQLNKYQQLRDGGQTLAALILTLTPAGADQSDAIRKVREAVMTANAAIALDGRLTLPAPEA